MPMLSSTASDLIDLSVGNASIIALLGYAVVFFGIVLLIISLCLFIPVYLFIFNYGMRISEKRLVAIEQSDMKILRYDDISSITVRFTDSVEEINPV